MKPAKLIESKHITWGSPCMNNYNQLKTRRHKNENVRITKLKDKKSIKNITQFHNWLKPKAGEGEKSSAYQSVHFSEKQKNDQKNLNHDKIYNKNNQIKPISSKLVFKRKFSKYDDVRRKLKAKFKSAYNSSGKFDKSSTKYKAYINKNLSKKNKSFLKYSMCSAGFIREVNKKKRTVQCSDLPGKGTYNHRFAYDQALQLHKKGIDVDVLYKVKNKTDSIYVINGEFLLSKRSSTFRTSKQFRNSQTKYEGKPKSQKEIEDAALLKEFNKIQKQNEISKKRQEHIAFLEKEKNERIKQKKHEEFIRKQNMREIEKKLRAEQLFKLLNAHELKEKNLERENRKRELREMKQRIKDEKKQLEIARANEEIKKLRRLEFQQNLALKFKNIKKNMEDNKLETRLGINPLTAYEGNEVITDSNIINDIERWALYNDGTVRAMSWLKIVTRRIDSLDERVDELYKNKWIRKAIDEVVDLMTGIKLMSDFSKHDLGHRKSCYKKNIKNSCSSYVVNTKRTARCHKWAASEIRRSPKFSVCPAGGGGHNLYKVVKTKEGSYFQVTSNVDTFGPRQVCEERTN